MAVEQAQIEAFVGKFATDLGAVLHGATIVAGDKLGLYKKLAELGPSTPEELADATGTDARYVREWLSAQAASEYCRYDGETGTFWLDEVQSICLADESHPAFVVGGMAVASSLHRDEDRVREAFTTGAGVGWHEHHDDLFSGTERFFRPGYAANLVPSWIPALQGTTAKLDAGATVADVGCGYGASTIVMAEAYPRSTFVGFDFHGPSIEAARKRAADAGVAARVTFETASAANYPGSGYDLVCIFDALHDMGDPVGALRHIRETLAADGALLLVEPRAGDRLEDNINLVGRIFYSASSFICTPASRSDGGDDAACLGAQAGEARLREVAGEAGFTRFRRASETPFNLVLELRP